MTNLMSFPGHFDLNESSAPRPLLNNTSFRRPWSPVKYDADITDNSGTYDYFAQDQIPSSMLRGKRQFRRVQNASEDSVEALDLADYAKTLRGPTTERNNPYPPFPHTSHHHPFSVPTPVRRGGQPIPLSSYPEYPPSPDNNRPFSAQSRDTSNQNPPSLVSGDTSEGTHDSFSSRYPYPTRRPYSLPPFITPVSTDHLVTRGPGAFTTVSTSPHLDTIHIASPDERDEADISRFPAFSRGWYDEPHKAYSQRQSSLPPYSSEFQYDRTGSYNPFPSTASNQARSTLPWGSQLADPSHPPVDDVVKEERIRMLEREFGKKEGPGCAEEPVIGSVNEKGALITVGPKKRIIARWAQAILALATAVSSLYGALFIKSPTPAPPSSKLPAFILYLSSVVTFFFVVYLFALRSCCGKRSKSADRGGANIGGMMVLPVQRLPGGEKKKKKKGKKDKHGGGGDVQVNLIVDPSMFGGSVRDEEQESDGDNFDSSQILSQPRGRRNQPQQRRSVFQGLAMESDWIQARRFLKRMFFVDIACHIIWAGVFILILFGKKCPPGGFNGWCDSYNVASATACILCVAFGFSVYFDIVDLHKSKASPRTRT